jgi:hypothetical protein
MSGYSWRETQAVEKVCSTNKAEDESVIEMIERGVRPVRCWCTWLLLALFLLPFVSPLLAAGPTDDASVPACCRKNGKHHCSQVLIGGSDETSHQDWASGLKISEKCPFQGGTPGFTVGPNLSLVPSACLCISAETLRPFNSDICLRVKFKVFRAHPKRGPPFFSNSSLDVS